MRLTWMISLGLPPNKFYASMRSILYTLLLLGNWAFRANQIDVGVQKIDSTMLDTNGIVIAALLVTDKVN